jgi:hypothetical protein
VATTLARLSDAIQVDRPATPIDARGSLAELERSTTDQTHGITEDATGLDTLELYRELAAAVNRIASHSRGTLRASAYSLGAE